MGIVITDGKILFIMVFQREVSTRKLQQEGKISGQFMTDSLIPFQMVVVSKVSIYFPLPFMTDPAWIKDPDISLI